MFSCFLPMLRFPWVSFHAFESRVFSVYRRHKFPDNQWQADERRTFLWLELIQSEKVCGRLRWRRAHGAQERKTWRGRRTSSWNFQQGKSFHFPRPSCRIDVDMLQALEHCQLDGRLLANWHAPSPLARALWGVQTHTKCQFNGGPIQCMLSTDQRGQQ